MKTPSKTAAAGSWRTSAVAQGRLLTVVYVRAASQVSTTTGCSAHTCSISRAARPAGDGRLPRACPLGVMSVWRRPPFDLTPEQKGMLAALSHEPGKPIPALIAAALKELQEHERAGHPPSERQAGDAFPADARQRQRP